MSRTLTLKQQRFISHYLKTGNATEAAAQAGYKGSRATTLTSVAYENLTKPEIRKAISQALAKAEISPEYLLLRFNEISHQALKDSDKLRALENLAKATSLTGFTNQPQAQFNGDIHISFGLPEPKPQAIEGELA